MAGRKAPVRMEWTQEERFFRWVMPEPNSGCWIWVGACQPRSHGRYGVFEKFGAKTTNSAHLFAYIMAHGPVPPGLEVDHRCRNTQCVNPGHLEAVPRRINLLRGNTIVAANLAKTHCPRGHAYTEENTSIYLHRKGYRTRRCRTCLRDKAAAYSWRKKRERDPSLSAEAPPRRRYRRVAPERGRCCGDPQWQDALCPLRA